MTTPKTAREVAPAPAKPTTAYGGEWTCSGCGRRVINASTMPGRPFWHDPPPEPGKKSLGPHECPQGRSPGADDPTHAKFLDNDGRVLPVEEQRRRGLMP